MHYSALVDIPEFRKFWYGYLYFSSIVISSGREYEFEGLNLPPMMSILGAELFVIYKALLYVKNYFSTCNGVVIFT